MKLTLIALAIMYIMIATLLLCVDAPWEVYAISSVMGVLVAFLLVDMWPRAVH